MSTELQYDLKPLTPYHRQRVILDLLNEGEVVLWNYPQLQDVYQLLTEAGFDTTEVHITGWESGGLQIFLSNRYTRRKSFKQLKEKLLAELAVPA